MSQRYVPPPNDGRYSRDRSPQRNPPGSYNNPPASRSGDYPPRLDVPPIQQSSSITRDVPRGPKALVDTPRGPPSAPAAPGGRGYTARGDYRGDFRDQPAGWSADRDKWNDRDNDRRDRRPSPPRPRASSPDFRDSRDTSQRDPESGRDRRGSRDGPITPSSYHPDSRGRGGFGRGGRGRGDWDTRPRLGRAPFSDGRGGDSFRPRASRSRSPPPYRRWERDGRDERDYDRVDNRWPDRRDDDRNADREEREREAERYKKEKAFAGSDSRRPSLTPTPGIPASRSTAPQSGSRLGTDVERDQFPTRKLSGGPTPVGLRNAQRDSIRPEIPVGRNDAVKEPHASRTSSPPRAPEVPAFGSISYKSQSGELPWNVWRAPVEQKSNAPPKPTMSTTPSMPVPTAPKAEIEKVPPKAPKADRVAEQIGMRKDPNASTGGDVAYQRPITPTGPSMDLTYKYSDPMFQKNQPLAKSPPNGPRQLSTLPSGPRNGPSLAMPRPGQARSPPGSPVFSAPSGPRALTGQSPANAFGAPTGVPTGPKGIRGPPLPPNRPQLGMSGQGSWQWNRFNHPAPPPPPPPPALSVPSKRDADGQSKLRTSSDGSNIGSTSFSPLLEGKVCTGSAGNDTLKFEDAGPPSSSMASELGSSGKRPESSPKHGRRTLATEEEDIMDLDENDFEGNEAQYQRDRAQLESKLYDLSASHLRGSVPLRNLAMLARISLLDITFGADKSIGAKPLNGIQHTNREETLPPNLDDEDVSMTDERSPATRSPSPESPSPIGTPELQCLQFLNSSVTPLSLSEVDVLQENLERHEMLKDSVMTEMRRQAEYEAAIDRDLREEFKALYKPWREYCAEIDKEREMKAKQDIPVAEVKPFEPPPEVSPSVQTPQEGGRRRGGLDRFASEFTLEQVMKESALSHQLETQKREKEAELSKPNPHKEAAIPTMVNPNDRIAMYFHDTTMQRHPDDAIEIYELQPPVDDFTEEEHRTLVQNFKEYPKKWGKLASALPDRTYKDCINHYYATKWNKEYKPPKDKRKRAGARNSRISRGIQGKPKANALISNLGGLQPDVYDGAEVDGPMIAMTERGRPKRAAAPTFGDKELEEQSGTSSTTPARKGAADNSTEKSASKSRGSGTRERGQRKPQRGRQPLRMRGSVSPEKRTPEMKGKPDFDIFAARDLEMANALTQLGQNQSQQHNASLVDPQAPMSMSQRSPPLSQQQHAQLLQAQAQQQQQQHQQQQQQRTGNSSYWSVDEKSIFPQLLEHYGTDWQSIAQTMGTKTHTMVKNFYYRVINSDSETKYEYDQKARRGNDKRERGEALGPPPPPSTSSNPRRRVEPIPSTAPRPLAPSTDVNDNEEEVSLLVSQSARPSNQYHATQGPTSSGSSQIFAPRAQPESPRGRPLSISNAPMSSRPLDANIYASSTASSGVPRTQEPMSTLSQENYSARSILQTEPNQQRSGLLPFSSQHRRDLGFDASQISIPSYYSRHEHQQRPNNDGYPPRQEFPSYRRSPPTRYSNPALASYYPSTTGPKNEHNSIFATSRPAEISQPQSSIHYLVNSSGHKLPTTQSSPMPLFESARSHASSPRREDPRAMFSPPVPPPQQQAPQAPPPRSNPPKQSNINSLLNAEPDEPRHHRSTSGQSQSIKTQTPPNPGYSYPPPPPVSRPLSQSDRRDIFSDRGTSQPSPFESQQQKEARSSLPSWFNPNSRPEDIPFASAGVPPQFRTGIYRDYVPPQAPRREGENWEYAPPNRTDTQTTNSAAASHNSGASVDWSSRANMMASMSGSSARHSMHGPPRDQYERPPPSWESGSSSLRGVGGGFERDQRERSDSRFALDRHHNSPTTTAPPAPSSYDRSGYPSSDPFAYRSSFHGLSTLNRPSPPPRAPASSTVPPPPPPPPPPSSTPGGTEMVLERRVTGMFSPPPGSGPPPPPRSYAQEQNPMYGQQQHSQPPNLRRSTSRER